MVVLELDDRDAASLWTAALRMKWHWEALADKAPTDQEAALFRSQAERMDRMAGDIQGELFLAAGCPPHDPDTEVPPA